MGWKITLSGHDVLDEANNGLAKHAFEKVVIQAAEDCVRKIVNAEGSRVTEGSVTTEHDGERSLLPAPPAGNVEASEEVEEG